MFSVSAAALLCGSADSGFDIIVDFMIVLLVFRLLHMWVYLLLSVLWLLVVGGWFVFMVVVLWIWSLCLWLWRGCCCVACAAVVLGCCVVGCRLCGWLIGVYIVV